MCACYPKYIIYIPLIAVLLPNLHTVRDDKHIQTAHMLWDRVPLVLSVIVNGFFSKLFVY